jgi:magnesium chelatase family protein
LAHNGVLFLDELPEYKRQVLEVLRQPLEDRTVNISRAKFSVDYPAGFMLVAAMNPCPCGYYNHPDKDCVCGPGVVQKYLNKVSGPLLDRIDIHIEVTPVSFNELSGRPGGDSSERIRERVITARKLQQLRFHEKPGMNCNAQLDSKLLKEHCVIDEAGKRSLVVCESKIPEYGVGGTETVACDTDSGRDLPVDAVGAAIRKESDLAVSAWHERFEVAYGHARGAVDAVAVGKQRSQ